jgi:hypothetical protein
MKRRRLFHGRRALTTVLLSAAAPLEFRGANLQPGSFADIVLLMIEVHLDAIASSVNFLGGIFLAIDALTAHRRTKVKRGGAKLVEGLQQAEARDKMSAQSATAATGQPPAPAAPARPENIQSPEGQILDSIEALENWADKLTAKRARTGFFLLAIGFGLDLFSKLFSNPLLFSI